MKKIATIVFVFLFLLGCSNDDDTSESWVIGKWNLTKIINTSMGGETTPSPSDTHYYRINQNGTFERVAMENNSVSSLEGTFIVKDESPNYGNEDGSIQKFIEFSYASPNAMFSNCGLLETNKQLLILTADNKLNNTLSGACDGYNYEYTKE